MNYLRIVTIFSLALFLFSSCNNDEGSGSATIKVSLVDAPADYDAVRIDIQDVQVNPTGTESGWQSLEQAQPGIYDLLKLTNGEEAFLGEIDLPEGKLNQVRLILGPDNELDIDGSTQALTVPSGSTSGLKLNVNASIVAGVTYKLVIDFDAGKSVVKAGQSGRYNLKPVLRARFEAQTGSIQGEVAPAEVNSVVYAINGTDSISSYPNENGQFLIRALDPGSYTVVAIPAPNSGYSKATSDVVTVTEGASTVLDVLTLQN